MIVNEMSKDRKEIMEDVFSFRCSETNEKETTCIFGLLFLGDFTMT